MVTVIIPVFNRPQMLLRAVRSVLAQVEAEFELIVVNDGSTESLKATKEIVLAAGHQWIDMPEQLGVSAARNLGVAASSGDWIAFLDSDDEWKPAKLHSQLAFHQDHPEYQIFQCQESWIRNGKPVNKKKIHIMPEGQAFVQSLELCCISPSSVIMKRELFENTGGFDQKMPVCEDYDLWLRITKDFPVGLVRESLVIKYGGHSDQLSRSRPAIDRFRLYALIKLLCFSELLSEQFKLVLEKAKEKCLILLKGAVKRKSEQVAVYRSILEMLENVYLPDSKGRLKESLPILLQAFAE